MTKQALLQLISELPDDADIRICTGDEILGDYSYNDFDIIKTDGLLNRFGGIDATYSNYIFLDSRKVTVWVIQ